MTRHRQTTVTMLGACDNQPIAEAGTVILVAMVETVAVAVETLMMVVAVAALPQCNRRGRLHQRALPPKFPPPQPQYLLPLHGC